MPSATARGDRWTLASTACPTTLTVSIAVAQHGIAAASDRFGANASADATVVIAGHVSLPAQPAAAKWPAPWISLPFTQPRVYTHEAGRTLVVDVVHHAAGPGQPWSLEAETPFRGARFDNARSDDVCPFSDGSVPSALTWRAPRLGGAWTLAHEDLLPNVAGVAWIGSKGAGATYQGRTLPIDLAALGAPGCTLSASPEFVVLLKAFGRSAAWPRLAIPNDPALARRSFYDHSLWFDPAANALGAVSGRSSEWVIGDGRGAPAALLYATGDASSGASGTLAHGVGVALRLDP
jgi:hypothetical protein